MKFRLGTIIGLVSALLTFLALYMNIVSFKFLNEHINLSLDAMRTYDKFNTELKQFSSTLYNFYAFLAVCIALSSFFSNKRHLVGILTLVLGAIHLGASFFFYTVLSQLMKEGSKYVDVAIGNGLYLLIISSIGAVVGSIMSLAKK